MDIKKLLEDDKFVNYIINRFIPFKMIYKMLDEDYNDRGSNMCIFHDNSNTPAARIYHNDNGDSLYCYSEQRSYRPCHAFRKGIVNHRIESIAYTILKQFNDGQIQALIDDFGNDLEIKPTYTEEELNILSQFMQGKISIDDFNASLIKILYKL